VVGGGTVALVILALAVIGIAFDRRYRPRARATAAMRPTGERFRDPVTGVMVEVYEDPTTGTREYRESPENGRPA